MIDNDKVQIGGGQTVGGYSEQQAFLGGGGGGGGVGGDWKRRIKRERYGDGNERRRGSASGWNAWTREVKTNITTYHFG